MPKCIECNSDYSFKLSDTNYYSKINVPKPRNCPECRMVRRFVERNPKTLYYRKCDLTDKTTLSQYHKDNIFPVYSPEAWWSDKWNALEYGVDFEFNRPFFEQFHELLNKVPHMALFNTNGTIENSDYNNCTAYIKNCYLIAESDYCEDCYYSNLLKNSNDLVDCSVCYDDELCYECIDCSNSKNLLYSKDCQNCNNSYFLNNCIACDECIGCINQRHKKFMIFNKQYSEDQYNSLKNEFILGSHNGVKKLKELSVKFFVKEPHKYVIENQNENCSGDHLYNSKNANYCFDSKDLEDCKYCQKLSLGVKDSMDYNSWGNKSELIYQSSSVGDNCNNVKFCSNCQTNISDCEYCMECFSISDCFGCIGLKKENFCILNKKYSEFEYYKLLGKILEYMGKTKEYGEFFPKELCPYGYNETMAMDIFPLTKEEATAKGYKWHEGEKNIPIKQIYNVPESIKFVKEDIINQILQCDCGKNYKIIKQEYLFYKKLNIPIPLNCPLCRHKKRMSQRKPYKLWERNCNNCLRKISSNYSPDKPEIIYCDECYSELVY